jgi:hypothetical protein
MPLRVQDSGLLKDTIVCWTSPTKTGDFDTVLVRRAADKLRESTDGMGGLRRATGNRRNRAAADGVAGAKHAQPQ